MLPMAAQSNNSAKREAAVTAGDPLQDVLLQHHVRVVRLGTDEVRKFAPTLRAIDAEIRERLSGDNLTTYSRRRLESLLVEMDKSLATVYKKYRTQLDADLKAFGQHEAAFTVYTLEDHAVNVSFELPTDNIVRAAMRTRPLSVRGVHGGKLLQPFLDEWTAKDRAAVTNAIRRGVIEGRTNADIVRTIRGTRAMQYSDGLLATSQRNAAATVQTAVAHVSSAARQAVVDANADIIKGMQWVATLDQHTCVQCRTLDGMVFKIDKGPRPPIHISDRCTMVPRLKDMPPSNGAERPSVVDGKATLVPASETYYAWLKRQSAGFQDEVLGPMRGKLLRDGGLSAQRFAALQLDRNFQPMTLDEMRTIEPGAFRRAGL